MTDPLAQLPLVGGTDPLTQLADLLSQVEAGDGGARQLVESAAAFVKRCQEGPPDADHSAQALGYLASMGVAAATATAAVRQQRQLSSTRLPASTKPAKVRRTSGKASRKAEGKEGGKRAPAGRGGGGAGTTSVKAGKALWNEARSSTGAESKVTSAPSGVPKRASPKTNTAQESKPPAELEPESAADGVPVLAPQSGSKPSSKRKRQLATSKPPRRKRSSSDAAKQPDQAGKGGERDPEQAPTEKGDPFELGHKAAKNQIAAEVERVMQDYRTLLERTAAAENEAYSKSLFTGADVNSAVIQALDNAIKDMSTQLGLDKATGAAQSKLNAKSIAGSRAKPGKKPDMHHVCNSGKAALLAQLLEAKENLNVFNRHGQTPLFLATKSNKLECAKMLLEAKADPGIRCGAQMMSPLHEAAKANNHEMVRLLLEYGADKHSGNRAGRTPLDFPISLQTWSILQNFKPKAREFNPVATTGGGAEPTNAAASAGATAAMDTAPVQLKREPETKLVHEGPKRPKQTSATEPAAATLGTDGGGAAEAAANAEQGRLATERKAAREAAILEVVAVAKVDEKRPAAEAAAKAEEERLAAEAAAKVE